VPFTDAVIDRVLEQFRSDDADLAWQGFLASYSDLIFGVIRTFTKDADHSADCFLFVCEKLCERKYRLSGGRQLRDASSRGQRFDSN